MHKVLWITEQMNHLFGGAANALLGLFGLHAHDPHNPITDAVAMQLIVAVVLVVFFLLVRASLSVERPGALQNVTETFHEFIENQSHEIIGHHGSQFTPFLMTIGLFVLTANLIGLIPGTLSPTQFPVVPLGCALLAFSYYHFHGVRKHGVFHYILHFAGPQDPTLSKFIRVPVSMLLFPIEIFSHLARVLSLTVRLYANMFAGEMVTLVFFSLIPIAVPALFLGLHFGVSFMQTFIFVVLTTVYLSGAVADEH